MLAGAHVLILEDEAFIALDLASTVEAANGHVVGPFASVAEALAVLATTKVAAAILDVNLIDGVVTPVAIDLLKRGIPLVVCTGRGLPDAFGQSHPDVAVYAKPTEPERLVEALAHMIATRRFMVANHQ